MIRGNRALAALSAAVLAITVASVPSGADAGGAHHGHDRHGSVRFATFNSSLNRPSEGELVRDLSTPDDAQAQNVAEIVQRSRPDVLLLQEFDYAGRPGGDAGPRAATDQHSGDAGPRAARDQHSAPSLFRHNYLERGQRGADPIRYPYVYTAPVNTGVPSGLDLDNDGTIGGGNDAYGFGDFPGQYGMVVYSKYPIDLRNVRTFQRFLWKDMPGARLPDDPATAAPRDWYSRRELRSVRLSSKSHWDLPIRVGRRTVHLLASHPTPPTFDGEEDRNGLRNADEIRFWADYVAGGRRSAYVYDDRGRRGGLGHGESFVIAGDQNSDPLDGDSVEGASDQLLRSERVNTSVTPSSRGAVEASRLQGKDNATHRSPARFDTADFAEPPGNIRADYVLPSRGLRIRDARVFWPTTDDPLYRLTGAYPPPSSDHRLVWVDVTSQRGRHQR